MRTGPRAVGILATASPAWAALVAALDELADADKAPPCANDPEAWTSEQRWLRDLAAQTCYGCPIRAACARFALANREPSGVWGGLDFTPALGRPPIVRT